MFSLPSIQEISRIMPPKTVLPLTRIVSSKFSAVFPGGEG